MKMQDFMITVLVLHKGSDNTRFNIIYILDCFAKVPDHVAFLECSTSIRFREKVIIKFCIIIGKEITGNQHLAHLPFIELFPVYHKLAVLSILKEKENELWITRN